METRKMLLGQLNQTVFQLLGVYQSMENPEMVVYEAWTARDILGHLTFWHESFARNVSDLVKGQKPIPLKGRYNDLNRRCLDEMRAHSVTEIITRFEAAHAVIQQNILNVGLGLIPYKHGSRSYTPEEHLDIVNRHIREHLKEVQQAATRF